MMKTKQAFNPYMPGWEYVPDAEPHIVGDRVYVYGSHDLFNGLNFCLGIMYAGPLRQTILETGDMKDVFLKEIRTLQRRESV